MVIFCLQIIIYYRDLGFKNFFFENFVDDFIIVLFQCILLYNRFIQYILLVILGSVVRFFIIVWRRGCRYCLLMIVLGKILQIRLIVQVVVFLIIIFVFFNSLISIGMVCFIIGFSFIGFGFFSMEFDNIWKLN